MKTFTYLLVYLLCIYKHVCSYNLNGNKIGFPKSPVSHISLDSVFDELFVVLRRVLPVLLALSAILRLTLSGVGIMHMHYRFLV